MTVENCLETINMCVFWISMIIVTLSADCHCGTLKPLNTKLNPVCHLLTLLGTHHILHISRVRVNLRWPFFAKGLDYFAKVLSFYMKMPGIINSTGQLFMAVHLIGYGSVQN